MNGPAAPAGRGLAMPQMQLPWLALSNIVLAAKFVRAVTGPGVRFSLLVARIVHFLLAFWMN